jgi:uncharacterized protein YukE
MTDGMLYNRAGLQTLYDDLQTYLNQLNQQQQLATQQANILGGVWEGKAQQSFQATHNTLMGTLGAITSLLQGCMNGVQEAESNAFTADTQVANTFFE